MKQLQIGTTLLTVENVYPFRFDYGKGKEVLRVSVLETNHSFVDLQVLKNCTSEISYIEDGVIKLVYQNYSLDFNCQYNKGNFELEITRNSEEAIRLELVESALNDILLG